MKTVYLSLGSNMGDKVDNLDKAVDILRNNPSIHKLNCSSYYTTDPVGYLDQDEFVNAAVGFETDLLPYQILDVCRSIESELLRKRLIHWGPRTIDVDVLLYEGVTMDDEDLTIPHPRMHERGFVLIPLMDLKPVLKLYDKTIETWINTLPPCGVRKM